MAEEAVKGSGYFVKKLDICGVSCFSAGLLLGRCAWWRYALIDIALSYPL